MPPIDSSAHTGPFWVSSNGDGVSTVYSVNPVTQATTKLGLTVAIPGDGSITGQVFNPDRAGFAVHDAAGNSGSALFIFASDFFAPCWLIARQRST